MIMELCLKLFILVSLVGEASTIELEISWIVSGELPYPRMRL